VHEIGHAMGILVDNSAAIMNFLELRFRRIRTCGVDRTSFTGASVTRR